VPLLHLPQVLTRLQVCVSYKDPEYLLEECEDGRRLGFTGKQAIHPNQVDTIQKTFVPTEKGTAVLLA
jgi:citrate lyase beta subunit